MAGTANSGQRQDIQRHNILNPERQSHPVQKVLTVFTLVAGLVSFALGMIVRNAHTSDAVVVITTATGLAACLVGLYVQMVSTSREQRIMVVTGIIAGFVGLAIALSRGGFVP